MTHELKTIFESFVIAEKQGLKTVLATVVDLDGSSYRKPGVRMLIWENGHMVGAVSGGCVEKEVLRQAHAVFETDVPKIMTYDGRYRLGCEGTLYILIEQFKPEESLIKAFIKNLEERVSFKIDSHYIKAEGVFEGIKSEISFSNGSKYSFAGINSIGKNEKSLQLFSQIMPPCFKLLILGAEHDAVELCLMASINGWEVTVVSPISDPKTIENFPGSNQVIAIAPEAIGSIPIDSQTAVVLMTHNFAKDLQFLLSLKDSSPMYVGLLGARDRKEKLMSQFLETYPEIDFAFLDLIHGPAGLDVGAITPQEIAVSIIAEILAVQRNRKPDLSNNIIDTIDS